MKPFTKLMGVLFVLLFILSCKKSKPPTPPAPLNTYLTKEVQGNVTVDYKYDNLNRYMGYVYRDGTNHQETTTTQFAPNNLPGQIVLRDYIFNRTFRYEYTYDAQNRCTKIDLRDSTNPTTLTLTRTYTFTYTPTKIIRSNTLVSTGSTTRIEFTIDSKGNFVKEEIFNAAGTKTHEYNYTAYDDKKHPLSAAFVYRYLLVIPTNNYMTYNGGAVGVAPNFFTAAITYNNDGYPTQIVYNGGTPINYTYEKR